MGFMVSTPLINLSLCYAILFTQFTNLNNLTLKLLAASLWVDVTFLFMCRRARRLQMQNLQKISKLFWKSFRRLSVLLQRGRQHTLLLFPKQFFLLGNNNLYWHWCYSFQCISEFKLSLCPGCNICLRFIYLFIFFEQIYREWDRCNFR